MKRVILAVLILLASTVAFAQTPEEATLTAPVESLQPNAVRVALMLEEGMATPANADDDILKVELAYFNKAQDGSVTLLPYGPKLRDAGYPLVVTITNGDPDNNTDNHANTCRALMLGVVGETAAEKLARRPRRLLKCMVDNNLLAQATITP